MLCYDLSVKGGVLVVGSMNLDMVVCTSRIPGPGENVCGGDFLMVPGGVAVTVLGAQTSMPTRKQVEVLMKTQDIQEVPV